MEAIGRRKFQMARQALSEGRYREAAEFCESAQRYAPCVKVESQELLLEIEAAVHLKADSKQNSVPVYVISLKRRGDKRQYVSRTLAPFQARGSMRVKIVDATDGNEIDSEFLTKANFCPWHAYSLQPAQMGEHTWRHWNVYSAETIKQLRHWYCRKQKLGEIGCAISHWRVWCMIAANPSDVSIVLEDDVAIEDESFQKFRTVVEATTEPWDLIYLARTPRPDIGMTEDEGLKTGCERTDCHFVKPGYSWSAYAYALSPSGAKKLVQSRMNESLMPVDEYLPALYLGDKHPRTDIAELIRSKQLSEFVALAWADPAPVPTASLATLVHLGGCCSDTENSAPLEPS
jgi:GR25 family glycosyltransferase involved in LPS biosynthesis